VASLDAIRQPWSTGGSNRSSTAPEPAPPDRGAFRWAGVDARTDVELRTHLGVVAPRVAGAWTLDLSVPDDRRVRLRVTVVDGGTATLNRSEAHRRTLTAERATHHETRSPSGCSP
jgi:hypothetical protein